MLAVRAGIAVQVFDSDGTALSIDWLLQQARERGVTAGIETARE